MTSKINKSHLILLKIIEKSGNKNCADCGVEGTRWASWNFGIFLCIRCAGIHRNLGVHISKVKSVDLDSWTNEQLQVMEEVGNRKSQQIYEAALPEHFIRPQTNYAIEEFIRAKYQYRRYCIDTPTPNVKPTNAPEVIQDRSDEPINVGRNVDHAVNSIVKSETKVVESDDSLSDPEYLIDLKDKLKKPCHKVHSDGDLINFQSSSKSGGGSSAGGGGRSDSAKSDNKTQILSLYNQSKLHGGYQSSLPANSGPFHHKTYGSSADTQFYCMTGIPASSQNSYLKQIQDKLSVIKDNLTSKFRQYEQPSHTSNLSTSAVSETNNNVSSQDRINHNGGQTLSPDLWR